LALPFFAFGYGFGWCMFLFIGIVFVSKRGRVLWWLFSDQTALLQRKLAGWCGVYVVSFGVVLVSSSLVGVGDVWVGSMKSSGCSLAIAVQYLALADTNRNVMMAMNLMVALCNRGGRLSRRWMGRG
jgi:hypothetical protein